jgi:hypothetical protein
VTILRCGVAAPLIVIAGFLTFYGGYMVSKVFAEYKDGDDAMYLSIAVLRYYSASYSGSRRFC